jgi:hypothetical protein
MRAAQRAVRPCQFSTICDSVVSLSLIAESAPHRRLLAPCIPVML